MSSDKEEEHFDGALDWESSRIKMSEKSETRAWRVVYLLAGLLFLSWAALALLIPLKERVPYLIRENIQTGVIEVLGSLDFQTLTYEEVRDKHWLSEFVTSRETYDWHTLQADYNKVRALSSPAVGLEYAQLFEGKKSLEKVYRDKVKISINIISAIPSEHGTATVRFSKTVKRVDDKSPGVTTTWVATLGYQYFGTKKRTEQSRYINPFGFTITSYRVDPELIGGTR